MSSGFSCVSVFCVCMVCGNLDFVALVFFLRWLFVMFGVFNVFSYFCVCKEFCSGAVPFSGVRVLNLHRCSYVLVFL